LKSTSGEYLLLRDHGYDAMVIAAQCRDKLLAMAI